MSRNVATTPRSHLALQSYLDGLLQEATVELEASSVSLDEFEAAVLEEQVRDARLKPVMTPVASAPQVLARVEVEPVVSQPTPAPVVEPVAPPVPEVRPSVLLADGRPSWAEEPFECLLFDV